MEMLILCAHHSSSVPIARLFLHQTTHTCHRAIPPPSDPGRGQTPQSPPERSGPSQEPSSQERGGRIRHQDAPDLGPERHGSIRSVGGDEIGEGGGRRPPPPPPTSHQRPPHDGMLPLGGHGLVVGHELLELGGPILPGQPGQPPPSHHPPLLVDGTVGASPPPQ